MKSRVCGKNRKISWLGHRARRLQRAVFGRARLYPIAESLELRTLLSTSNPNLGVAVNLPTDPVVVQTGQIARPGTSDQYRFTLDSEGRLRAHVHAQGLDTLLTLVDDQNRILIQSEAISPTNLDDHIDQHLPAGTYHLIVSGMAGSGTYQFAVNFVQATAPLEALGGGSGSMSVITADLNGDHVPDVIVPDYYNNQILIDYGTGDGTFMPPVEIPVDAGPLRTLAADFNHDGRTDLAVANQLSNTVSILLNNPDGTFQLANDLPTTSGPTSMVVGDFEHDGQLDLAVADQAGDCIDMFHGKGDGTFTQIGRIGGMGAPASLAVADFNGDGRLDLAVASAHGNDVIVLVGVGNGSFLELQELAVGPGCRAVVAADFNGDGKPDLAAVSADTGTVSVFLNAGGAFLAPPTRLSSSQAPYDLIASDFDGDGRLDLAVCNYGSSTVSMFHGLGDGTFEPATSLSTGGGPMGLTAADLAGRGHPDILTSDFNGLTISLLLNNGDGTFQNTIHPPTPPSPSNVRTADLNGDGILDLVFVEQGRSDAAVLLGRGDGTFRDPLRIPVGSGPFDVTVADLNGDHIPDLAVPNYFSGTVSILLGVGDGTFKPFATLPAGEGPSSVKAPDLNGDGLRDLVVANYVSNTISIYYGLGGGRFTSQVQRAVGQSPSCVDVGDFNSDGRPDLAVSNVSSNDISILFNLGGGNLSAPISVPGGDLPWWIIAGDLNGDGHPDLVTVNGVYGGTSNVSILLGTGHGTFLGPTTAATGISSYPMCMADMNGDGHPDLLVGNDGSNDISLLLGRGDGTFQPEIRLPSGSVSYGLAVGDFNRDGRPDLASANFQSNDLTIDLARPDGTYSSSTISLGGFKLPMLTADFNGDNLPDLAIADPSAGMVRIRTSEGDGTFEDTQTITVGGTPSALAEADLNGDGRLDLAVTDSASGQIIILYGLGDATFQEGPRFHVGQTPSALVAADLNGDGLPDLAVADRGLNSITILLGRIDGKFSAQPPIPVGSEPVSIAVADLNGDGRPELVIADQTSGDLTFLWNIGGRFIPTHWRGAPMSPSAVIATDFDGDGITDIGIADQAGSRVLLLMGSGGGAFAAPVAYAVGQQPIALSAADLDASGDGSHDLVVADAGSSELSVLRGIDKTSIKHEYTIELNGRPGGVIVTNLKGDSHPDLAVANASTASLDVYLGGGDGVFTSPQSTIPLPTPSAIMALVNGLPLPFLLTLDDHGQALVRYGIPGFPGEFDAPLVVTAGTGISVADAAVLASPLGAEIAALDSHLPMIWVEKPSIPAFTLVPLPLPDGGIYTRMVGGDLNGDGRDDLMVIDRASDQLLMFCQDPDGDYYPYAQPIHVGFGPTDVALADVFHNGFPDLVIANGSSGDVSIIPRGPGGTFGSEIRLRSGLTAAGTVALPSGLYRSSGDEPVDIATGVFDASGLTDIVVLDRGSDRISILKGTPGGGFADPSLATSYSTGLSPSHVSAAPLGRDGRLDLAVLNQGSGDISIFMNDGKGGFNEMPRVDAGAHPTGLSVHDVNGDGAQDLLVNDDQGDVLVLLGNGNGTFRPYQRTDRSVNFAVGDLTGTGQADFVLSNAAQDELSVLFSQSSDTFLQGRENGLRAPGTVAIADMNGDGISDLILANRGGNEVLVYLNRGKGRFDAPQRFYTGTSPSGLTISDLNGDGLPDLLVANSGSNDITMLLGENTPTGWTMRPGPRLDVGSRPVATTVGELEHDSDPDIVSVNQLSNSVTVIRSVGSGYFADRNPLILPTGPAPIQAFAGRFGASPELGLVILNSQSNAMTYYSRLDPNAATSVALRGQNPIAGVMADLNHDGYADLIIANSGDPRLNVFFGGTNGPVFGGFITLSNGVLPTSLALSNVGGKGLELFVSTGSDNHVVPVSLTAALVSSGPAGSGGFSLTSSAISTSLPSAATVASGLNAGSEPSGGGSISAEAMAQAVGASVSSGAATQATSTVAAVSQAIQPQLFAAFRSLSWLLDNLAPREQGQISDILPLAQNDLAAVAVILAVPNLLDASDPEAAGTPTEGARPIESVMPTEDPEPLAPASSVDRFLANVDATLTQVARGNLETPDRRVGWAAEWVWRQSPAVPIRAIEATPAAPADGGDRPMSDLAIIDSPPTDLDLPAPQPQSAESAQRSASTHRVQLSVLAVVVATMALAWRKFGRRVWQAVRRRPEKPVPDRPPEPALWSMDEEQRESLRSRSMKDLPPWVRDNGESRRHASTI